MMKYLLIAGILSIGAVGAAIVGAPAEHLLATLADTSSAGSGQAAPQAALPDGVAPGFTNIPDGSPGADETTGGLPCQEVGGFRVCAANADHFGYDIAYEYECGTGTVQEEIWYHRDGVYPALVFHGATNTRAGWIDNRIDEGNSHHVECVFGDVLIVDDGYNHVAYPHQLEAGAVTTAGPGYGYKYVLVGQQQKHAESGNNFAYSEPGYSEQSSSTGTYGLNSTGAGVSDGNAVDVLTHPVLEDTGLYQVTRGFVGEVRGGVSQDDEQFDNHNEFQSSDGYAWSQSLQSDTARTRAWLDTNPAEVQAEQLRVDREEDATWGSSSYHEDSIAVYGSAQPTSATPYSSFWVGQRSVDANGQASCQEGAYVNGQGVAIDECQVLVPELPRVPQLPTFPAPPPLPAV